MALVTETRTIANAGTTTEAINLTNYTSGSFSIPSAFTGTTITPQYSNDNSNWTAVGSAITVATNGTYDIPSTFFNAKYGRFVAGSSQGAERTITFGLRK
jgi:hypothetical protein